MKTILTFFRGGAACPQDAGSGALERPESALRTTRSTSIAALLRLLTLTLTFTLTPLVHAQYQSTTYALKGGWNAIYLHGDATHTTLDALLASHAQVVSVWRWNPNPKQVQFTSSTLIPTPGTPEWSVWNRGGSANTLTTLTGQAAYLIECTGAITDTISVPIVQKVIPPRSTWVRNGANLLGFPSRLNGTYPNLAAYFATFPIAIATNTKIFKYAGGVLSSANPIQVFDPAAEPLDRNQAYWFEAAVVSNFYAPLEVSPSNLEGLHYGRNGSLITVRVRNRTAATVTLTVAPVSSFAAPVGQDQIAAAVPLTRRTFNTGTNAYEFTAVTGAFNVVLGPQSAVELDFGVDRAQITGATDALFASLLRFTDSGNLLDISLPVSARVTSLSGLWIGDATVSGVQSHVPGVTGTTTGRSFPLRVILHVDDSGNARLLSHVFMGRLAAAPNNLGICTLESALKQDEKATARRFTAAHLPPDTVLGSGTGSVALGQTLGRTISVPYNAPTNPYVHTYHPDHDNRNARFDASVPAFVESPDITRACSLAFTTTPPSGVSAQGWGSSVIGGNYTEIISGIRKAKKADSTTTNTVTVTGTFVLRRVSELGSITTN